MLVDKDAHKRKTITKKDGMHESVHTGATSVRLNWVTPFEFHTLPVDDLRNI